MMDITEPDFYSGKIIKPPSELLNEAHNHLQDAGFYAEAGEKALCLASIAKVYELHEQMRWVGLTDMERQMIINKHDGVAWETTIAIEQQLKEKNA
jgi:hypothetical protein